MTVSIKFRDIATSIAERTIGGVNVKDIDTVPESALDYCPVFYPIPNGFVSDVQLTVESFGGDSARALNLAYTLNYRYLHAPIGSGSTLDNYAGIIDNLVAILEAIATVSSTTDAIDIEVQSVSDLGATTDVAGQISYHGVDISLRVLEYIQ